MVWSGDDGVAPEKRVTSVFSAGRVLAKVRLGAGCGPRRQEVALPRGGGLALEACILILALPLTSCGSEQGSYPGLCIALSLCHPGDKGWGSAPPRP